MIHTTISIAQCHTIYTFRRYCTVSVDLKWMSLGQGNTQTNVIYYECEEYEEKKTIILTIYTILTLVVIKLSKMISRGPIIEIKTILRAHSGYELYVFILSHL